MSSLGAIGAVIALAGLAVLCGSALLSLTERRAAATGAAVPSGPRHVALLALGGALLATGLITAALGMSTEIAPCSCAPPPSPPATSSPTPALPA